MKQVIQHMRTGKLKVDDVPESICKPGGILVRNAASLISAGTEKLVMEFAEKSLIGKARARPDLFKQLAEKIRRDGIYSAFQTVRSRLETPVALGYSSAGVVIEVGRGGEEFQPGDRVACAGMNYASHAEAVFVPKNLAVKISDGVSFDEASFVTLGSIALQGVRTADVKIGETVAVIGLGLIGQLTIQILRASGCRVIGIDIDPYKVKTARLFNIECALNSTDNVEAVIHQLTAGYGVDSVIIAASGNTNNPIELAGIIARDRAVISIVGAVRMDIPRKLFYEKELQLRMSRSYGPGRYDHLYEESGIDYPIGYVRWTERRNMAEFMRLLANKSIILDRLITHRFPIEQAESAYKIMRGGEYKYLGIVLTYPNQLISRQKNIKISNPNTSSPKEIKVGVIGGGSFAKSILIPELSKLNDVELIGLASATGCNAKSIAERFRFEYATTDYKELLSDNNINTVLIATRHNSHASIVCEALKAGKNVFTEKPLAINKAQLQELLMTMNEYGDRLMTGFNRRFSPLSIESRRFFKGIKPLAITYRINAGAIPKDHWIHLEEGGGRIIGEVCHFIDLIQFISSEEPTEVFAFGTADTLSIVVKLHKGSIANINYYASGDGRLPKERIEIYGGGQTALIENFNRLELFKNNRRKVHRLMKQDKGFSNEFSAFIKAIKNNSPMPVSLRSMALTTMATFAIEESLRSGCSVKLV